MCSEGKDWNVGKRETRGYLLPSLAPGSKSELFQEEAPKNQRRRSCSAPDP